MVFWKVNRTCFCPFLSGLPSKNFSWVTIIPEPALLTDLGPVWKRWVGSKTRPSTWDTKAQAPQLQVLALMPVLAAVLTPDRLEACHPQRHCAKMTATELRAHTARAAVCSQTSHFTSLTFLGCYLGRIELHLDFSIF